MACCRGDGKAVGWQRQAGSTPFDWTVAGRGDVKEPHLAPNLALDTQNLAEEGQPLALPHLV